MSNTLARILSATASLILTSTMAVASASANVPADTSVRQVTVHYADLNLANSAGRATLEHRLQAAAKSVCPDLDSSFAATACRSAAIAKARADLQRAVPTAS